MFLASLKRRNHDFVQAVVQLHQQRLLEPNTYVIDLETFRHNADIIVQAARQQGIQLYGMTKQLGHNPLLHRALVESGIESFVAVDWMAARQTHRQGFRLGHVGHLVQPPERVVAEIVAMRPEVITVFNREKAQQVSVAALAQGVVQDILLRIHQVAGACYPGHEGGFTLSDLPAAAAEIGKLSGVNIVGITSFPCLLFSEQSQQVAPTPNAPLLQQAAAILRDECHIDIQQINFPGTTSASCMSIIAQAGGTHVEPGHGLTGTTPLNSVSDQPEVPAILYLSEISHRSGDHALAFGGGLYVDPVRGDYPLHALVGKQLTEQEARLIPKGGIDYYGRIFGDAAPGDSVIFGSRPQIFVTRGQVAIVDGIQRGVPQVLGYFDAMGNPLPI